MSEHLRTAKIPCKERVRKYRVQQIGVFSEKRGCPEGAGVSLFFGGWGGGGVGWTIFPPEQFLRIFLPTLIKAIISIHMYIVRSSICHPSKYQTSKFFFLDFQN